MSGLAIVYDGTWGNTGEKIDARYVEPIPAASEYWSAHGMDLGPAPTWTSRKSPTKFDAPAANSQIPTVYESTFKVLRFNGVNQRMDLIKDLSGKKTFFFVGRMVEFSPGSYVVTGGQTGYSFNLYSNGAGKFSFYLGDTGLASTVDADSSNRIFILVMNGDNSVLRVDSVETFGSLPPNQAQGIRLGASATGYWPVDIHAMGFIDKALNSAERDILHTKLKKQYLNQ